MLNLAIRKTIIYPIERRMEDGHVLRRALEIDVER